MPKRSAKKVAKSPPPAEPEPPTHQEFQCTLCMGKVSQDNIRKHFRVHHKITKVGAVEKLVTMGAAVQGAVFPPPAEGEETEETEEEEEEEQEVVPKMANNLGPGSLVQGHVVGYPWWPAIVNKVEGTPKNVTVS